MKADSIGEYEALVRELAEQLGAGAGIMNVYRVASGIGLAPGTQTPAASGPSTETANESSDAPETPERRSGEDAVGSGDSASEGQRGESA